MNDSAIINIISSIYSKIVIFFLSIFIIFVILFFALLHGIHIHELHVPYVKIKELYIKWDEKFIISIEDAEIFADKSHKRKRPLDPQTFLSHITDLYYYFQKIDIRHLRYRDITASIKYAQNSDGYIKLKSKFFQLQSTIFIDENNIYLHIAKLHYIPWQVRAQGYALFDKSNKILETNLDISLFNEAYFNLHANLEGSKLYFKTQFQEEIKHPKKILEALGLPQSIRYWAIDAYTTTGLKIEDFKGNIDLKHPKQSLTHIYVLGEAKKLVYRYNKEIEPVTTTSTLLEFKNGILYIRPKNPTSYGFDLQKSYLSIDFVQEKNPLILYLKFDKAKLDNNILHILKTYHINVPMKQLDGYTKTDLVLTVYLRGLKVKANGTFNVKKGKFHYLGNDISVKNLLLHLKDTHIWTKNMEASIKNEIESRVDFDLYLSKQSHGIIDFYVNKVDLGKEQLLLNGKTHIKYYINRVGLDTIDVPKTSWKFQNTPFEISSGKYSFNPKTLDLVLPIVKFDVDSGHALFYLSGDLSFKKKSAKFDIDLVKMHFKEIELAQSDLYLHLGFTDNTLDISADKQLRIYVSDHEATLDRFEASFKNGKLKAQNLVLTVDNMLQSRSDIDYNVQKKRGKLTFKYLKYTLGDGTTLFECDAPLPMRISAHNGLKLSSKKLATVIKISGDKQGSMEFYSLKRVLPCSPVLQTYKIKNGYLKLTDTNKGILLHGDLTSEYALLVNNEEKIIDKYKISGLLASKSRIKVNNKITIDIGENINIKAKDTALNVSELERIINAHSSKKQTSQHFLAHLEDGYLYLSRGRRILFDTLDLQTLGHETTAQLKHKKGNAGFSYKERRFYLYGSGFGDDFMEHLFFLSKFKGGLLDFNIVGAFDDYRGIVEITDATIIDYKILNNILAFIDTVPSLITFSLPSYSREGLKVKKAYASFHYHNDIFDLDNIRLDSTQLQIIGKGKASYKQNFIDLALQLKTNLANKVSKIPVVGYIIFDGKSISTTLKVFGKLTNPEVTTMLAKDIVVAPLNIIKRTLILPAHLLGLDKKTKDNNETKK